MGQAGSAVGVRVVRGPDWKHGQQDGGAGCVGTVVRLEDLAEKAGDRAVCVAWDTGTNAIYRAGLEDCHDLRAFDNASKGVKHPNVECDACATSGIRGMRWKCAVCHDYDLCHTCYMTDKHDMDHSFLRYNDDDSLGAQIPKRSSSVRQQAKGTFPGAMVVRGPHWRWENQDGGKGKKGKVKDICSWGNESSRSACHVTWPTGRTDVYRLGHAGMVDVTCDTPVTEGCYYPDHLPVLGKRTCMVDTDDLPFSVGDKVRIGVSEHLMRGLQEGHGGWSDEKAQCVGRVGMVHYITETGDIGVHYEHQGRNWRLNPKALSKIQTPVQRQFTRQGTATGDPLLDALSENLGDMFLRHLAQEMVMRGLSSSAPGCPYRAGDSVRIDMPPALVARMQEGHGGWNAKMLQCIGKPGKVLGVDKDGDVVVRYEQLDNTWALNPDILTKLDERGNEVSSETSNTATRSVPQRTEPTRTRTPEAIASSGSSVPSSQTRNFSTGDKVFTNKPTDKLKTLQAGHGGWVDDRLQYCGQVGTVDHVRPNGDVAVRYDDRRVWEWHGQSLMKVDDSPAAEPSRPQPTSSAGRFKTTIGRTGAGGASAAGTSKAAFQSGDKVQVTKPVDELKRLQEGHGGWAADMAKRRGKVGTVIRVRPNGDVEVCYDDDKEWKWNSEALSKVADKSQTIPSKGKSVDDDIKVGDKVHVAADAEYTKAQQQGHGGWVEPMRNILGKVGEVVKVFDSGNLRVAVGGKVWTFNPTVCRLLTAQGAESLSATSGSKDSSKADDTQQDMGAMKNMLTCSICFERNKDTAFLCGHSACSKCADSLKICHICRKPIEKKISLFL